MYEINYFKGREIDFERPVEIYRNLNRKGKVFSIRQDGLVVAHTTNLVIKECKFKVSWKMKATVMKTRSRMVHAWITGKVVINEPVRLRKGKRISYNPFTPKGFTIEPGYQIESSDLIHLKEEGVFHIGQMYKRL